MPELPANQACFRVANRPSCQRVTNRVTDFNRSRNGQMISLTNRSQIERDGFTVVENVLNAKQVTQWLSELDQLFATNKATIKNRQGAVYAARNILSALPECCNIANITVLAELLTETLGPEFGLVRGLYFDKHPDRTWSLPWHKDLTISTLR